MNDRQIFFGIGVGLLTTILGASITLISQAGWNLLFVGFALTCLAAGYKLHAQLTRKEPASVATLA